MSWQIPTRQSLSLSTAQPARLIKPDHMEVLHSFHGTLKNLLPQGTLQLFLPLPPSLTSSPFLTIAHHLNRTLSSAQTRWIFSYGFKYIWWGHSPSFIDGDTGAGCVKMWKGIGSCEPLPEYRKKRITNIKIQQKIK